MIAEFIIGLFIYLLTASIMIGIGVSQLKSKTPVAFYSGEKPFEAKELSDVSAWNRKHGIMWITYGIVILLSYLLSAVIGLDSACSLVLMTAGAIAPIAVMIWYHNRLIRTYRLPSENITKKRSI